MIINIEKATEEHVKIIAENVREDDKNELWASLCHTPEQVMSEGIRISEKSYTGLVDGVPFVMFGVYRDSLLIDIGTPWLVASGDLDKIAIRFLKRCRKVLVEIFDGYDRLENYVDARNVRAIEWLKFMGFEFAEEPEIYGLLKKPFYRFWKER